jgi:hypothetical protein
MTHPTLTPSSAGLVANGASRTTFASTEPARERHKIIAALEGLSAADQLPHYLSDADVRRRAVDWLRREGCAGHEIPSETTFKRELPLLRFMWRQST